MDETFVVDFLSRTSLNVSREIMLYDFAVRYVLAVQRLNDVILVPRIILIILLWETGGQDFSEKDPQ